METTLDRMKNYLLTSILALTFGMAGAGTASAQQNVKVVNTDREPVPTVARGVTAVRDIDQPARQPFYAFLTSSISDFESLYTSQYTVPNGKRAVIEQISIQAISYSGNRSPFAMEMHIDPDGVDSPSSQVLFLAPGTSFNVTPAQTFNTSTHLIRYYADQNSTIRFRVQGSSSNVLWSTLCTVSGYLIDIGGR
jgi:hypothetical protein